MNDIDQIKVVLFFFFFFPHHCYGRFRLFSNIHPAENALKLFNSKPLSHFTWAAASKIWVIKLKSAYQIMEQANRINSTSMEGRNKNRQYVYLKWWEYENKITRLGISASGFFASPLGEPLPVPSLSSGAVRARRALQGDGIRRKWEK